MVSYKVSFVKVQLLNTNFLDWFIIELNVNIIAKDVIRYNTILVKERFKLPNKGAFINIRSLI